MNKYQEALERLHKSEKVIAILRDKLSFRYNESDILVIHKDIFLKKHPKISVVTNCDQDELIKEILVNENGSPIRITIEPKGLESVKVLQELVDKETPMELCYEADGYYNGELVYDVAVCQNCNRKFEIFDEEHYAYCPNCGQKLDWSDCDDK